ncbi:hypothetical protein [Helicobacter pylori]|uniref:hypothetical protein n=1 Tax=Helicobacter pylori TaxID=210 RepID=UPI001F04567A|nr:hypothetical protein [Helicobacter pylori]NHA95278.1 hypothetical protein [Helicobacter pylori]
MKQNFKKGGFNCFFIILCKVHEKFLFSLCFIFQTFLKPPKQKSQISLVFGMNALVPLGTI